MGGSGNKKEDLFSHWDLRKGQKIKFKLSLLYKQQS